MNKQTTEQSDLTQFIPVYPCKVRRTVEGLAAPQCGHYQGEAQTTDGGLCRDAATLSTSGETAQPSSAGEHDILLKELAGSGFILKMASVTALTFL